jgi:amino-acid N-acetyltransferase
MRGNMEAEIQFTPAAKRDEKALHLLLEENGLPNEDISKHIDHFILARDSEKIVGCIGSEVYGEIGFVRSLAVKGAYRNQGIAGALYEESEKNARSIGIRDLYLLTVTAEAFFTKRGWTRIDRGDAPEVICRTEEFKDLCPVSAICMRKRISSSAKG